MQGLQDNGGEIPTVKYIRYGPQKVVAPISTVLTVSVSG